MNLKNLREAKSLSRTELAKANGIRYQKIRDIEVGIIKPENITLKTALKLAQALDCRPEDLTRNQVRKKVMYEDLRSAFIKRLTVDSLHQDARRKDFNQAIFDADEGFACFNGTDLDMVLEKFDAAVRDLTTTKSGRTATKSSQNPGSFARSLFLLNTVKYNCQLENTGNYKGGKHNERHEHYR